MVANYDSGPTLLGRNWLSLIKLEWGEIFSVSSKYPANDECQLNELLSKHKELFTENDLRT